MVMDRLYPALGYEAQPSGIAVELARKAIPLSLRATMERKPVHDFPLPFTHRRSQDYTK